MRSIYELDEYCRLHNKSIKVHHGKLCGIVAQDYEVSQDAI